MSQGFFEGLTIPKTDKTANFQANNSTVATATATTDVYKVDNKVS